MEKVLRREDVYVAGVSMVAEVTATANDEDFAPLEEEEKEEPEHGVDKTEGFGLGLEGPEEVMGCGVVSR